ncbi:hypothetical protein [Hoyosella subflava]|uniref:Secreted protein n=1 Tax=Hoyosella subflava (strain DSM 45089 / JCM 17490 / NBRC 109087 / DQS3-9A1) TaxID=443218 RepID=F6ERW1_HOYSD|nr:hypothetical protein [Hoyosella subflava]AEF40776.1 hypothetical protein AS9A_2329 [Hoyosella subflava DQS3-9A1]
MRLARSITAVSAAAFASIAMSTATAAAEPVVVTETPVTIFQLPAHSLVVSGLVVPGIHAAAVTAASPEPGHVTFAAPTRPEVCATTFGGALVRIDYLNIATGNAGTVTVRPCENFLEPTPTRATANTGSGPVVFSVGLTGTAYRPTAGQPSIPGVGTFTAP